MHAFDEVSGRFPHPRVHVGFCGRIAGGERSRPQGPKAPRLEAPSVPGAGRHPFIILTTSRLASSPERKPKALTVGPNARLAASQ